MAEALSAIERLKGIGPGGDGVAIRFVAEALSAIERLKEKAVGGQHHLYALRGRSIERD